MKKLALMAFFLSSPAYAAPYNVEPIASSISFAGQHAGKHFGGGFQSWTADIDFDPANLAASHINATIDTTSAKTGDAMYDGTLPTEDWFNSAQFPQARFTSKTITQNADGSYTARGMLTIKDVSKEVELPFTLIPDAKAPAVQAKANLKLDRIEYHIGVRSDAMAEWVSREIDLSITIAASRG